jgi:hypothetical protein
MHRARRYRQPNRSEPSPEVETTISRAREALSVESVADGLGRLVVLTRYTVCIDPMVRG